MLSSPGSCRGSAFQADVGCPFVHGAGADRLLAGEQRVAEVLAPPRELWGGWGGGQGGFGEASTNDAFARRAVCRAEPRDAVPTTQGHVTAPSQPTSADLCTTREPVVSTGPSYPRLLLEGLVARWL